MIGDSIWYALWDSERISTIAQNLVAIIGEKAKAGISEAKKIRNRNEIIHEEIKPIISSTKDLNAAFEMLSTPFKSVDFNLLKEKLEEFGIDRAEDLSDLETEFLNQLVVLVKPALRKKFLILIGS
jgi:hypothetical protein